MTIFTRKVIKIKLVLIQTLQIKVHIIKFAFRILVVGTKIVTVKPVTIKFVTIKFITIKFVKIKFVTIKFVTIIVSKV
jgi:hypothetical protein